VIIKKKIISKKLNGYSRKNKITVFLKIKKKINVYLFTLKFKTRYLITTESTPMKGKFYFVLVECQKIMCHGSMYHTCSRHAAFL